MLVVILSLGSFVEIRNKLHRPKAGAADRALPAFGLVSVTDPGLGPGLGLGTIAILVLRISGLGLVSGFFAGYRPAVTGHGVP